MKKIKNRLSKDLLMELYLDKQLSAEKIASIVKCGRSTVLNYLHKFNIKIRKTPSGKNNPNYRKGKLKCKDCNKILNSYSKNIRCRECYDKYNKGANASMFGKHLSQEAKDKISKANYEHGCKPRPCPTCDGTMYYKKSKTCKSCSVKQQHRDGVFNYNRTPNKPEISLNRLLNSILPNKYKFVGDGKLIVDTFNPDFIDCNGQNKIIELFGEYWHRRDEVIERDKRRLKIYKSFGYKTLIVWEFELRDLNKLAKKLVKFDKEKYSGIRP